MISLKFLKVFSLKKPGIFVGDKLPFILFIFFSHSNIQKNLKDEDSGFHYAFNLDLPINILLHFPFCVCMRMHVHI